MRYEVFYEGELSPIDDPRLRKSIRNNDVFFYRLWKSRVSFHITSWNDLRAEYLPDRILTGADSFEELTPYWTEIEGCMGGYFPDNCRGMFVFEDEIVYCMIYDEEEDHSLEFERMLKAMLDEKKPVEEAVQASMVYARL